MATEVVVAIIGFGGIVTAAAIPSWRTKRTIGSRNGQGTVVQMLEHVIEHQTEHALEDERRFAEVQARIDAIVSGTK